MFAAISLAALLAIPNATVAAPVVPTATAIYEDADLKQGRLAFTTGEYLRAVEILKPYVEKKQKSYDGYFFLGLSYRELQRFDEAVATLEKAIKIKPKDSQAHFELGQTYLRVKNYEAAVQEYRWLAQQKKNPWVADEFRLSIPLEVAKQYQLPPSPLERQRAELAAEGPLLPMSTSLRPYVSYREKAKYTEEARDKKVAGTVVLRIVFSRQGTVIVTGVVRGLPYGLTESAIEATKKIRFTPAMKDGKPVSVVGMVEYNFTLY